MRQIVGAVIAFGMTATVALAQSAPKIFVSSTGLDSNDGGRATPKRSFQAAHDSVAAGGEIVVLDTAGYGKVSISKSVSIVVPLGVSGFVTTTSSHDIGIYVNAGSSSVVTLRGLIVEGVNSGGGAGVILASAGSLVIEDTTVRNFYEGISVQSTASTSLVVRGGSVRGVDRGLHVQDYGSPVNVDVLTTDMEFIGDNISYQVEPLQAASHLRLVATRCAIAKSSAAFYIDGTGAEAVVDGCVVAGNVTAFSSGNGGIVYTRGNNTIYNNQNLGTAPTPLPNQ